MNVTGIKQDLSDKTKNLNTNVFNPLRPVWPIIILVFINVIDFDICEVIKWNESYVGNIDFEMI